MKKVSIIFLFVILIISYQNIIFASYNDEILEEELQPDVEQVFIERSKVWNGFLMGNYSNVHEVEKDLKGIITDPLLESDIKMFSELLENPVSYEQISNVSVEDIFIIDSNNDEITLEITTFWDILGYQEKYKEELKYIVKMKKDNNKDNELNWLLSDYEISG